MNPTLHIARNFHLPTESVTQTFGILAKRGAGKSNTARVMAEEMYSQGLPFVAVDPVGAWWGLRSSRDGKKPGLSIPIFGGLHGDVPLEPQAGALLADLIAERRLSCVLDVSQFEHKTDRLRFLTDFGRRLYHQKAKHTAPVHLFLEEADDYVPQKPMSKAALPALSTFDNIVRRGRARGLGITLITQRSAVIHKDVLTQIETLIAMRTTAPQDLRAIGEWIKYQGEDRDAIGTLPNLDDGEAWIYSPHFIKCMERRKIRLANTFDSGATPEHGGQASKAATMADIDLVEVERRMSETIERAKAEDPRELRAEIARLNAQVRRLTSKAEEQAPPEALLKTRNEGAAAARAKARPVIKYFSETVRNAAETLLDAIPKESEWGSADESSETLVPFRRPAKQPVAKTSSTNGSGAHLPKGERAILIACAQWPEGVLRKQLTVLTGYRRSSRDTYLQRLLGRGLVETLGQLVRATDEGVKALGSEYQPLPVGDELREYWLNRLPEGERKILEVLAQRYPDSCSRLLLDELTGYKRSSRDTYLQRMKAKQLVEIVGGGEVRAAGELFG